MLDLRRLRLLRELSARGTVHAVAEALDYTPSAVSQGLAALEREAGVPLLERAGRGVRLTDAGQLLARRAQELLADAEAVESELAAAAGTLAGTIRIAGFQTAILSLVAPAIARLVDTPLRFEVAEVEVDPALTALRLGALDVVIGDEYDGLPLPRPDGVERELLIDEEVRIVLPVDHPLAARKRIPMAQLKDAAWATGQPGTMHRDVVAHACRRFGGFEPDLRHRTNDLLILLELVRSCGAVAMLPDLVGAADDPTVAVRSPQEGRVKRRIFALTRAGASQRPAIAALLTALRSDGPRGPSARPSRARAGAA